MLDSYSKRRLQIRIRDGKLTKINKGGKMRAPLLLIVMLMLVSCAPLQTGPPGAKTAVTGAAGGGTVQTADSALERCSQPLGTLALHDEQDEDWSQVIANEYRLPPVSKLLRLIVRQSNCFVVVEQQGSNFGKEAMEAADYTMKPTVIFPKTDSGVLGAAVGTRPRTLDSSADANDGTDDNETSTLLTLVENLSGGQIAFAEGSASNFDFGALGVIFSEGGAGLEDYENTPEGIVIAAAFADSFNQTVQALKHFQAQDVQDEQPGKGETLKIGN